MGKMPDDFDPLHMPPQNVRLEKDGDIVATFFPRTRMIRYQGGFSGVVESNGKVRLPTGGYGILDEQTMVLRTLLETISKQE